jgi:Flp pilus assembly pilin Flp
MQAIFKTLHELAKDEDGANLAEYALLLAVLSAGIAAVLPALQNTLQGGIVGIADQFGLLAQP